MLTFNSTQKGKQNKVENILDISGFKPKKILNKKIA